MTKKVQKKPKDLGAALAVLDDDQLIDFIFDMEEEIGEDEHKARVTKKRMDQWKKIMGFITELRGNGLLEVKEKNHLRAWLIKDEYISAIQYLESKQKGILDEDVKELITSLITAIKKLA